MDAPASNARTEVSVFRRLTELAMPVVGLNMLGVLTLAVDTAMCGRLESAHDALTALGFAAQLVFLLMVAMMGLSMGSVALAARAHGAGDTARVNHVLHQSTMLTIGVSVVVAIVGNLGADSALRMLGADGDVREVALSYMRPLLTWSVFSYVSFLYASVLRGVGNTSLAFRISIAANLLNVLLDYVWIFGKWGFPALGVRGAAYGTLVAQAFSAIAIVVALRRNAIPGVRARLRFVPIDMPLARTVFRIGLPVACDMLIVNISFMTVIGMLARVSPLAVAAHGIGMRIQSMAFVPGLGVSQAVGAMVGNALGASNVAEMRAVTRSGILLSASIMTAVGTLIVVFAHSIVGVFDISRASELGHYSMMWIQLLGLCMPIVGVHLALIGTFRGAGATWMSLWVNMLGALIVQIPMSWLLGFPLGLGAFGIWLGVPLGFAARLAFCSYYYRRGRWIQTGVTI